MNPSTPLEKLRFTFEDGQPIAPFTTQMLGVVGSGNLEVLVESTSRDDFVVEIETSAKGFEPIWSAVLLDFHEQYQLAGVRFSINDMGATPAVVGLRMRQALAQIRETR